MTEPTDMDERAYPDSGAAAVGIRGLGVDIVEIDRMKRALERHPQMRERVFSERERAYCDCRNKPEIHYAMRFAAKEAVLKALGTGFRGMRFRDVEVMRDEQTGRPIPVLHGRAAEVADERGVIEMHVSLSFTHATAVASAVAITAAHRPKPKEQPHDPMAELHASFKEARAMLDGIEEDGEESGPEDEEATSSPSAGGENGSPMGDEHDQEAPLSEES